MMGSDCDLTVLMAINKIDEFTHDAISSILSQTFMDFEFRIICNGADGEFIADWLSREYRDERITTSIVLVPGLANALNFGLSIIKTKYVARMDADDLSLPQRFAEQIKYLNSNPEVGVLGCNVLLINEHGEELADKFMHFSSHGQIVRWLPIFNSMCHPALMFRTECLRNLGGYKYGFHSEDHELFIRISRESEWRFANLKQVLFKYRRHGNQMTGGGSLRIFAEVSGYLLMHLFKSGNILFLVGIMWVSPPVIWAKKIIRSIIRMF